MHIRVPRAIAVMFFAIGLAACAPPNAGNTTSPATPSPTMDLTRHDALTLGALLNAGELTAAEVTDAYLLRIREVDDGGPMLNAIIEINPDARTIAAGLDERFATDGPVGPLHGLPVIVKASIDTGDAMATSAGSVALADHRAANDAHLVTRLRAAGAVVLGKANMSDWANFRSTRSTSGWSSLGGQTRNPHVLDRNPCGSSSGSAVAVAASLTALAVGTETDGSVICPSAANGIVGIKPTVGLVSRGGIVPVAASQDTAGPMAKTVTGAALLLEAMAGPDEADPASRAFPEGTRLVPDRAAPSLAGIRIGVLREYTGSGQDPSVEASFAQSLKQIEALGATLVDPVSLELDESVGAAEFTVLLTEFKANLNAYLENHDVPEDRDTLTELIAWNEQHRDVVMPIFGQEIFHAADATTGLANPDYLEALAASGERLREAVLAAFSTHGLDALVVPSNGPAWKTDWVLGDRFGVGSSTVAAVTGYPSITVPAGAVAGLPLGISFIGLALQEPKIIRIAYAFEQATAARIEPAYLPTLER